MSQRSLDSKQRWRCKTVAFRVSPEEAELLDRYVYLSGMTKQEYLVHRVLQQKVVVHGNSRIYKALRDTLSDVLAELKRIEALDSDNGELLNTINFMTQLMIGFHGKE